MSILALKEAYALAEGWVEHLEVTREAQRKFLQDHFGTWIDALVEQLRACDPHPFYAALGQAVQRLTRADVGRLHVTPLAISGWLTDPEIVGDAIQCPRACGGEQVESALPNA